MSNVINKTAIFNEELSDDNIAGCRFQFVALGIFHTVCLASIAIIPAYTVFQTDPKSQLWQMPVILANAFVAFGITSDVSERKPSEKWKSLWALWLLLGFAGATIIIRALNKSIWPIWTTPLATNYMFDMTTRDLFFALGCFIAMTLILARSQAWNLLCARWRVWVGPAVLILTDMLNSRSAHLLLAYEVRLLLIVIILFVSMLDLRRGKPRILSEVTLMLLVMAAYYNRALMWLPSFMLVFMGCYVAFASLGCDWLIRAATSSMYSATTYALVLMQQFAHNVFNNNVPITALPNISDAFLWIRHYSAFGLPWNYAAQSACYLSIFPSITFALAAAFRGKLIRYSLASLGILQILGLIITGRRVALLVLGMLLFASLIIWLKIRSRALLMVIALCLISLVIFSYTKAISSSNVQTLLPSAISISNSEKDHADHWRLGLELFRSSPVVGVGFGQFQDAALKCLQLHNSKPSTVYAHSHSDYIDLLCGGGIIAFILAICATFQLFLSLRVFFTNSKSRPLRMLLLGILVQAVIGTASSAATFNMFLIPHWILPIGSMLAAVFGAEWAVHQREVTRSA